MTATKDVAQTMSEQDQVAQSMSDEVGNIDPDATAEAAAAEVMAADVDANDAAVQLDGDEADEGDDLGAPSLEAAIEALLMVADDPIPVIRIAEVVRRPVAEVEQVLVELAKSYVVQRRGFDLRAIAGGWRFYTSPECSAVIERYVLDGQQARLTQAALETLAVIAYRQPVSRARISAVRGVNVDGVVRTLQARGLIEEAGHDQSSGAILYRTTSYFMERLGIASLDELPPLAEHLPELDELEDVLGAVATGD